MAKSESVIELMETQEDLSLAAGVAGSGEAPMKGSKAFSVLASSAACLIRARKAMEGSGMDQSVPEAIKQAWSTLMEGGAFALTALQQSMSHKIFFAQDVQVGGEAQAVAGEDENDEVEEDDERRNVRRLAVGHSEAEASSLAKGIAALAAQINDLSSKPSIKLAGAAYAPMLAHAGSEKEFAYPMMALALRPSRSGHEGVKVASISAGIMPAVAAGDQKSIAQGLSAAAKSAGLSEEASASEGKRLEALAKQSSPAFDGSSDAIASGARMVAALSILGNRPTINGDNVLPSVAAIHAEFESWAKSGLLGLEVGKLSNGGLGRSNYWNKDPKAVDLQKRARAAVSFAREAASSAIAMALAPDAASKVASPVEFDARFGLFSGPLAQSKAAWEAKRSPAEFSRMGSRLFTAIVQVDPDYAVSKMGWHNEATASLVADWLASKANSPLLARALGEALELDGALAGTVLDKDSRERMSRNMHGEEPPKYGVGHDFAVPHGGEAPKARAGSASAVSMGLEGADPRLGLAQWATRAALGLFDIEESSHRHDKTLDYNLEGGGKAFIAGRWAAPEWTPGRRELAASLAKYCQAIKKVELCFIGAALDKAASNERDWLASHGLDKAVEQAAGSGPLTSKSVAWAVSNPVSESLASNDPMARLGAKMSRSLGLRPGGDAELVEALREEFSDLGCGQDGFALVAASGQLQSWMGSLAVKSMGRDQSTARAAKRALGVAAKAIQACVASGLSESEGALFVQSISKPSGLGEFVEALEPGMPELSVGSAAAAKILVEVGMAKRERQPILYAELARDWQLSRQTASDLGVAPELSLAIADSRMAAYVEAMPHGIELDWRKQALAGEPIWNAFGLCSHRLQAAIESARALGGVGLWCAQHAKNLGVMDAADANDLMGKCRDAVKAKCSMGDGAWRLALKGPGALELISESLDYEADHGLSVVSGSRAVSEAVKFNDVDMRILTGSSGRYLDDSAGSSARVGYAIGLAAAQGLDPVAATEVLRALCARAGSERLFDLGIPSQRVEGPDGARFYLAEAEAKKSRMPKVFQEACKRHAKFTQDRAVAIAAGSAEPPLAASERIAGEIADLVDWLSATEHGAWQTFPKEPTWGQLTRLSRAWHEEQAAREVDNRAREEAKRLQAKEESKLDPFAPNSAEHWGEVLGRHAREGWEAVELTCAAHLSEEGSAMSHCVSGYSPQCRQGKLRIFSIRLNGERKCTLEISGDLDLKDLGAGAAFKITQNKGRHNAEVVNAATRAFCKEALSEFTKAWEIKSKELAELRRIDEEAKKLAARKKSDEAKAKAAQLKDGGHGSSEQAEPAEPMAPGAKAKSKVKGR